MTTIFFHFSSTGRSDQEWRAAREMLMALVEIFRAMSACLVIRRMEADLHPFSLVSIHFQKTAPAFPSVNSEIGGFVVKGKHIQA